MGFEKLERRNKRREKKSARQDKKKSGDKTLLVKLELRLQKVAGMVTMVTIAPALALCARAGWPPSRNVIDFPQ